MALKTERMPMPAGVDKVVSLLAKLMLNDLHRVVLDFDVGDVEVRWSTTYADDLGQVDDVEPKDLVEHVRIVETDPRAAYVACNEKALAVLMNETMLLASERQYGVGWVIGDPETVKLWLGIPVMLPLNALLGLPVYPVSDLPKRTLLLMGARTYGAPIRSVSSLRKIRMGDVWAPVEGKPAMEEFDQAMGDKPPAETGKEE